jgi:hypothetical protein
MREALRDKHAESGARKWPLVAKALRARADTAIDVTPRENIISVLDGRMNGERCLEHGSD